MKKMQSKFTVAFILLVFSLFIGPISMYFEALYGLLFATVLTNVAWGFLTEVRNDQGFPWPWVVMSIALTVFCFLPHPTPFWQGTLWGVPLFLGITGLVLLQRSKVDVS